MHKYRTHNCDQLRAGDIDKKIRISGWIQTKRDHGDLLFLDIRDHYGITQCVIEAKDSKRINDFSSVKNESVVTITGVVAKRGAEAINSKLNTGEIEIKIEDLVIQSRAEQIPFQIVETEQHYPEELRLKYRFLDLRRKSVKKHIILRSEVIMFIRELMVKEGFCEIQTPILTCSSPEGARDFIVPSRLNPGKFYALPQAPQQFKQILMVSGFDKYFQIAPCFRDEDSRADRSPGEFYQLDIEMSYVEEEDIFVVIERVLYNIFTKFSTKKNNYNKESGFPHISYKDALLKYGTDKPDLRNPIIICDATDIFKDSGFSIFAKNIKKGSIVRAIPAPATGGKPRSFFDKMIDYAISQGAGGLAYIIYEKEGGVKSPIAKLLGEEKLKQIKDICSLKDGDAVFFTCDKERKALEIASHVRQKLGHDLNLIEDDVFQFCWIVDFPFFEKDPVTGKIDFAHNPFSMPKGGLEALKEQEPLDILSHQYDIVCNGVELSSGAIRNHDLVIMYEAFKMVGYKIEEIERDFSGLIKALKYGAPPHGGIAPGVDRIIMLLAGTENIREVIPFPMNGVAQDLLMGAPNVVELKLLEELGIKIIPKD